MQSKIPPPGSKEAINLGCTCPVLDNAHGKGIPSKTGTLYWFNGSCEIHTKKEDNNEDNN